MSNIPTEKSKEIFHITMAGLVINVALAVFKFVAGIIGNSQAVVADSIHTLSDIITDLAIIIGAKHWTAPADKEHPYGHGRIETAVALFIGLSLAGVAIRIAYESISTIKKIHDTPPNIIAFIAAAASILCKEALYHWTVYKGKKVKSSAVIANAWHHRSDAFSSIPVAAAVAVSIFFPHWAYVDHIGAVIVAVFIILASINIIKNSLYELVDSGVSEKVKSIVWEIAASHSDVREVHGIRARRVGSGLHVDLHILVEYKMSVQKAHAISEKVKLKLLDSELDIVDVIVHIEPYPQNSQAVI